MSNILLRGIFRRPINHHGSIRLSPFRFDSNISQATGSMKQLSSATSKATESISRAASVAGPALSSAAKGLSKTLGNVGGRTGQIVSFIQRQIPSAIFYTRVTIELSKLVFHGQKMVPPPLSTFESYFQRIIENLRNPKSINRYFSVTNPQEIIQRVRHLSISELAPSAVLFAELLGFFTIGEIIGKFKLIGYRGEISHHH